MERVDPGIDILDFLKVFKILQKFKGLSPETFISLRKVFILIIHMKRTLQLIHRAQEKAIEVKGEVR